jgi:hypothetical protein
MPEEKALDLLLARLIADYDDEDGFAGTARARNDSVPDPPEGLKQREPSEALALQFFGASIRLSPPKLPGAMRLHAAWKPEALAPSADSCV